MLMKKMTDNERKTEERWVTDHVLINSKCVDQEEDQKNKMGVRGMD